MTITIDEDITLPAHASYSAITTFLKCGWSYYLGRIKALEEEPSVWLTGGSAFHKACENFDLETL